MSRERLVSQAGGFILLVVALIGCRGDPPPINQTVTVSSSSTAVTIPAEIQRIAVLYPHSSFRDYSAAYQRLEGALFQLKTYRPRLKFVDRFNVPTVMTELRFQHGGAVTENSAM